MIEALLRPARPAPLAFCVALSLLVTLSYRPGTIGALVYVTALFMILRYGFAILERRAQDPGGDDRVRPGSFARGFEQPLKLLAVIILFAILVGAIRRIAGELAGYAVLLLLNLAAPACLLVIALENSLVDGLNPRCIHGAVARIGFDYFAACFVLVMFSLLGDVLLDIMLTVGSENLRLFVYSLASCYYVLAVFFLMGWLISRHHDDLVG